MQRYIFFSNFTPFVNFFFLFKGYIHFNCYFFSLHITNTQTKLHHTAHGLVRGIDADRGSPSESIKNIAANTIKLYFIR